MAGDYRGVHGGYSSELEPDSDVETRKRKRHDMAGPSSTSAPAPSSALVPYGGGGGGGGGRFALSGSIPPPKRLAADLYDKEDARQRRQEFLQLNAYDRHKMLVNNYLAHYGGKLADFASKNKVTRTDVDVIREHHQFLWDEDDEGTVDSSWERSLAKKYYDKLFKEYCIADLSRFRENKVAMRWRTEQEVVSGKGQFVCGERKCRESAGLASWEVNFGYEEKGVKKNALIKLRLCPDCSNKLNFNKKRNLAPTTSIKPEIMSPKREAVEPCPAAAAAASAEIWQQPTQRRDNEEKTVEEEIDTYLAGLFP